MTDGGVSIEDVNNGMAHEMPNHLFGTLVIIGRNYLYSVFTLGDLPAIPGVDLGVLLQTLCEEGLLQKVKPGSRYMLTGDGTEFAQRIASLDEFWEKISPKI